MLQSESLLLLNNANKLLNVPGNDFRQLSVQYDSYFFLICQKIWIHYHNIRNIFHKSQLEYLITVFTVTVVK